MKYFLAILFCISILSKSNAQHSINGIIKNIENKGIPFVNVLLLNQKNSNFIKGNVSDELGYFELNNVKSGKYSIKISAVGFKEINKNIDINKDVNLGSFLLEEEVNALDEVTIEVKKAVFEQKVDRLAVNVKGTLIGESGTALEVLERLPGVDVGADGTSIALNGKSDVGILLNDKLVKIPISSLLQMLSSTNAKNIESIELIPNPPAKYSAEFTGGLINIIQAKKTSDGTSASIILGAGYGINDKEKAGINWNYRKNKVNLFGDFNFDRNSIDRGIINKSRIIEDNRSFLNTTDSDRNPIVTGYNGRFGFDYYFNDKVVGGLLFNTINSRFYEEAVGNNISIETPGETTRIFQSNEEDSRRYMFTINANIGIKIDSTQNISFDVDYLNFYSKAPNLFIFNFLDENENITSTETSILTKRTPVNVWVGKADYSKKINKKLTLDFGTKYIGSTLDNTIRIDDIINGLPVVNEELSDRSDLVESISAAYSSLDWKVNDKTKMTLGLRYEYYTQDLNSVSNGKVLDSKFSEFFPSLFISRDLGEYSALHFSFGRRISRPTYLDLSPSLFFFDLNTAYFGNIGLKSAISNIVTMRYKYKKYSVSLEYSNTDDAIARSQGTFQDGSDLQILTSLNLDYLNTLNLSLNLPFKITSWWEMQNFFLISSRNQKQNNKKDDAIFYSLKSTQTFTLPKDYSIQIYASYNSDRLVGVTNVNDYQRVNLSFNKKIKKWDSSFQLSISDIFDRNYSYQTADSNSSKFSSVAITNEARIVRLTFTHNFGNSKVKKQRKRSAGSKELERRIR